MLAAEPEKQMATQIFFLMSSGLFLCAGLNFAAIRFLDFGMPLLYYTAFPIFASLVLVIIISLLPLAISIHVVSGAILDIWTCSVPGGRKENPWLRKKVKSMRTIRVYAGVGGFYFYKLDESVLTTYFVAILDWTINLLMTFHPRAEDANAFVTNLQ